MRALVVVVAMSVLGCRKGDDAATKGGLPTASPSGGTQASGPRVIKQGPRPRVRNVVATAQGEDPAATARLMLSTITPGDTLPFALKMLPPARPQGGGGAPQGYDWGATALTLKLVVKPPTGPEQTLELSSSPSAGMMLFGSVLRLELGPEGLTHATRRGAFKAPAEGLFKAVGSYQLRIAGQVVTGEQKRPFALSPLSFEVVEAGPSFKPLAEIKAAAQAAHKSLEKLYRAKPTRVMGVVDDVEDARWVRMLIDEDGGGGYTDSYVDARVMPTGEVAAMQGFSHFTCVAEGTQVSTPSGPRPVEQLLPGDTVTAFDVERGQLTRARVVARAEGERARLVRVGEAWLTAEHPVYADGVFTRAGELRAGQRIVTASGEAAALAEVEIDERASRVFDITVEAPHTFFAGGVLVHNKTHAVEFAPGDPWEGIFKIATDEAPGGAR